MGFRNKVSDLCKSVTFLTVSLDCPFLIAPSVFFNVYKKLTTIF